MANQPMNAQTPATRPTNARMNAWGITRIQDTSGRQRAMCSGGSKVKLTGYAAMGSTPYLPGPYVSGDGTPTGGRVGGFRSALEVGRQPEVREELGVEEVVVPGDAA